MAHAHTSDESLGVVKSAGASGGHSPVWGGARGEGSGASLAQWVPSTDVYQNHGFKIRNPQPHPPHPRETLFQEVQSGAQEAAFYFSGARVMLPQGIPEPCT